jgi:hypothetical protein
MDTYVLQFEYRNRGAIVRSTINRDFANLADARLYAAMLGMTMTQPSIDCGWAYIWKGVQAMKAVEVMNFASDGFVMDWQVPSSFYDEPAPRKGHTHWNRHA